MDLPRRCKATSAIGFITPLGLATLKLVYREAVEDMVEWIEDEWPTDIYKFVDDNCRVHKANLMKAHWEQQTGPVKLEIPKWPPYYPNMNPI